MSISVSSSVPTTTLDSASKIYGIAIYAWYLDILISLLHEIVKELIVSMDGTGNARPSHREVESIQNGSSSIPQSGSIVRIVITEPIHYPFFLGTLGISCVRFGGGEANHNIGVHVDQWVWLRNVRAILSTVHGSGCWELIVQSSTKTCKLQDTHPNVLSLMDRYLIIFDHSHTSFSFLCSSSTLWKKDIYCKKIFAKK